MSAQTFMDTFIMAASEIWKMRNAVIFDGARRPTVQLLDREV
jgi:hypothetical protein